MPVDMYAFVCDRNRSNTDARSIGAPATDLATERLNGHQSIAHAHLNPQARQHPRTVSSRHTSPAAQPTQPATMTDAGAMEVVETSGGADGTYTAPLHPSGQVRINTLTPTRAVPLRPPTPTHPVSIYLPTPQLRALLFEEVTNTDELRAKLMSGELPEFGTWVDKVHPIPHNPRDDRPIHPSITSTHHTALVNPDVVASTFHLLLAASTALMYERANALHVKTLHAELIYALAPSCNISEAFRVFGAGKGDTKVRRSVALPCVFRGLLCCCAGRDAALVGPKKSTPSHVPPPISSWIGAGRLHRRAAGGHRAGGGGHQGPAGAFGEGWAFSLPCP